MTAYQYLLFVFVAACFSATLLAQWYALWVVRRDIDNLSSRVNMLEFMNDMTPESRESFDAYREKLKQTYGA